MPKQRRSFVKQAMILAAAGIIVRVLGFAYRIFLTDLIGDEGNGIYAAGYNIYIFLLILSSAGLPAAISKMVSERVSYGEYENARRVFRVSLIIASGMGLVAALVLGFGADWFSGFIPGSKYTIISLAPTVFIVAVMSSFRGYFQGMNNTIPTGISQVAEQIFNAFFSVLLAYILMKSTKNVELGAAGGTAGTGIGALVGLLTLIAIYMLVRPVLDKRAVQGSKKIDSNNKITRELVRTALPIVAGTAIISLTNIIDMLMVKNRLALSGLSGQRITELYGQLNGKYVTLTTLPISIATAFATAALPNIAAHFVKKEQQTVDRKVNMAVRITMVLSIPSAVGIGVLGDQILLMLFPRYPGGGILLRAGALSIIFLALASIATGMLQAVNLMRIPVIAALLGGIIKIQLNYFLLAVPQINIIGAVISTTVCYAVVCAVNMSVLTKAAKIKFDYNGILLKPLAASAIMGLFCFVSYYLSYYTIHSNTLSVCLAILVSVFVYLFAMIIIRGFGDDDLAVFPGGRYMKKLENLLLQK